MTYDDDQDPADGPPDPQLDPTKSPGFGADAPGIEDIEIGRDITLGEADLDELMVSDTSPVDEMSIGALLEQLTETNPVKRRRAALGLAKRDRTEAGVLALAVAARKDPDDDVRQFAVEALGQLGGEPAADTAVAAANDDDPWVRAEAIVALDRLDRHMHADRIEIALDDSHHAVRRNALISIFKRQGTDAREALLTATEDPSERVREWAAHMLGGIDDEQVRTTLERLVRSDESRLVRSTAQHALTTDAARFRRGFTGAADTRMPNPEENVLNRSPDL
ncbi:HEAT repeat domain-containing protein [Haladaptatus sp. NG-SE-30]